jgi:EmrB/QacA subfamily drug resistance transporter
MISTKSSRWWALGAVVLAVLAVSVDLTVLSVAMPTLAGALKASESDLQWFSSAYALVLAASMVPAGLLGDRYGRKKVMMASLGLFAVGSFSCACSRSPAEFILSRLLLGLAAAGLVVMAVSAIAVLFSEEERPKAVGVWAAANMIGFPIGPVLGGWLLSHYWWGWVFLMNVPVAVVGLLAVAALVPESRSPLRPRVDVVGILASSVGLLAITYGLIEAGEKGWGSPAAVGPLLAGLAVVAGFFAWERMLERRPGGQPLVDVTLFSSRAFTWSVVLSGVLTVTMVGALFITPQYFQGVVGTTPQGSGLRLLAIVVGVIIGLLPAQRATKAMGAKLTVALGFALLGTGLALGCTTSTTSSAVFVATWMVIGGAGVGLTMATTASAALSELPQERAGVGSAVLQTLDNTGAPFGTAIMGSALSSAYVSHLRLGGLSSAMAAAVRSSVFAGVSVARQAKSTALLAEVRRAFMHGMDVALGVSIGFAAIGLLLCLLFLPRQALAPRPGAVPAAVGKQGPGQ